MSAVRHGQRPVSAVRRTVKRPETPVSGQRPALAVSRARSRLRVARRPGWTVSAGEGRVWGRL